VYSLASTTKYHVLLDQTAAGSGGQERWTNVKRALFRFIDLLPVGSRLNMIAFSDTTREVLPTTTVTELNRDGLFGRIPRRKAEYLLSSHIWISWIPLTRLLSCFCFLPPCLSIYF
jgi:hypothetical protein